MSRHAERPKPVCAATEKRKRPKIFQRTALTPSTICCATTGIPPTATALRTDRAVDPARRRLNGFLNHLIGYFAVMVVLVPLNLWLTPDPIWFVWPMVGGGSDRKGVAEGKSVS